MYNVLVLPYLDHTKLLEQWPVSAFQLYLESEGWSLMKPHFKINTVISVVSWLVHSSPDQAVRVRALAGDTVLCSWARH